MSKGVLGHEAAPRRARVCDLPAAERPRERLGRYGVGSLSTAELLAVLLGTGHRSASAVELGAALLAQFGLAGLARASVDEICQVHGCGPAKAAQIKAAIELGRRAAATSPDAVVQLTSPADAAALLQSEMALLEQEHLRVVLLNIKNHVVAVHEVYKGSVNASIVRVGEVFREPVRRNCPSVIVAHNHPSGDPTPSVEDVNITRRLVQAGRILDIDVLDHIVIGRRGWVSLRERGHGFS
ncbi:MAG: RadC family protein [Anaerolineae bacterium]